MWRWWTWDKINIKKGFRKRQHAYCHYNKVHKSCVLNSSIWTIIPFNIFPHRELKTLVQTWASTQLVTNCIVIKWGRNNKGKKKKTNYWRTWRIWQGCFCQGFLKTHIRQILTRLWMKMFEPTFFSCSTKFQVVNLHWNR